MDDNKLIQDIIEAIYNGEEEDAAMLGRKALDAGMDPNDVITNGGMVALERLSTDFDNLEVFLPELMLGGEAMQALIDVLSVAFTSNDESGYTGTVVIGCAKGDLHDIGKNLVVTQLAVNGYKVYDLGTDVSVNQFIDKAKEVNADIIAVSSLLTTSAYYQEQLVKSLDIEGLRDRFKVIVGGGPITASWTKQIGADGYSRTAHMAIDLCNTLMAGTSELPVIVE